MKLQQPMKERKSRYFCREGLWFFATREGIDIGPFDTQQEAIEGARVFLEFISAQPQKTAQDFVRLQIVG